MDETEVPAAPASDTSESGIAERFQKLLEPSEPKKEEIPTQSGVNVSRETSTPSAPAEAAAESEPEITEAALAEAGDNATHIDAPASMSAAEKAAFAKLTPELQAWAARRESELSAGTQKVADKASEERKALEASKTKLETEAQRLADLARRYKHPDIAAFEREFADILTGKKTLEQLLQEDPLGRYQQYGLALEKARAAHFQEQAALAEVKKSDDAKVDEFRTKENAEFRKILNIKDDKVFGETDAKLSAKLLELGATPDMIRKTSGSLLALAWDGIRYREAVAKLKAGKQAAPAPVVQKPGVSEAGNGATADYGKARTRLKNSGDPKDAAAIFERML